MPDDTVGNGRELRFFSQGVAVCLDVCGIVPHNRDNTSVLETDVGRSTWDADPVQMSRESSARREGMGAIADGPAHRTTTPGRRQMTLIRTMQTVEQWLATNRYRSLVVTKTSEGRLSATRRETDTAPSGEAPSPPTATPSAGGGSGKRKKKKGGAVDPKAALVNNGKRRNAHEQHCLNLAVNSLASIPMQLPNQYITKQCRDNLNGTAVDEAHGVLGDLLQAGGCYGATRLFDTETYLVSHNAWIKCAHCAQNVNVVQSVAFAEKFGRCARCGHPRCMNCVNEDIELQAANVKLPDLLAEPSSVMLGNCLMCCGVSD